MDLFTLNKEFIKQAEIDKFESAIWTERYYGDSDVTLVVPATLDMVQKLPVGTYLGMPDSDEIMLIDTSDIKDGALKVTGGSLTSWLNNRFVRTSAAHEDRYWNIAGYPPGQTMALMVYYMCIAGPYLTGGIATGIPNPQSLIVPGLWLKDYDVSGSPINVAVPFGPLYDALRELATTYEIGLQTTLESADETGFVIGFRTYKGIDRTSGQSTNPVVRYSPSTDSLTGIEEIQSNKDLKNVAYAFAPANPDNLATIPGTYDEGATGWDRRAMLVFADDVSTDMVGGNPDTLGIILYYRALTALTDNRFVRTVDGEISPAAQFKYGRDYNLGDVIEVQGNSGIVQQSRITEYIRAQDSAGERAYPTVAMLG